MERRSLRAAPGHLAAAARLPAAQPGAQVRRGAPMQHPSMSGMSAHAVLGAPASLALKSVSSRWSAKVPRRHVVCAGGAGSRSWSASGESTRTWSRHTMISRQPSAARTTHAPCGRRASGFRGGWAALAQLTSRRGAVVACC